jgi:Carboxypeptidase regulatory-like domain
MSTKWMLVSAVVAVVAFSGQSVVAGDDLASVTGKVFLDGKPLASAKVVLHFKDGQFAGAKTKDDGTYKVDRLPTGTHKVTVESIVKGKNVLPPNTSDEEKSALQIELMKGKNVIDLQLKSR